MSTITDPDQIYHVQPGPVAVGGVGGSGTRLIAAILEHLGFCMGSDRNPAGDNLAFTLLFKTAALWPLDEQQGGINRSLRLFLNNACLHQPLAEDDIRYVEELAGDARLNAPTQWLRQRAAALICAQTGGEPPRLWGWKEPNTHIFLPALHASIPAMKYIHVMRHGLDMAYSVNQAQVHFWGEALTGKATTTADPLESFRYWCAAHRRVIATGQGMGTNFLLLNYDEFCSHPERAMDDLLRFLDAQPTGSQYRELLTMVRRPASIGRHRNQPQLPVPAQDLALLRELGFDTSW